MSPSQQYDLKFSRNPFTLHKQQKNIYTAKNHKEKTSSKKQRVLLASSPQLRTFYNLSTQRQSNRLSLKQTQPPKNPFFKNYNSNKQTSQYQKQQITGYRSSLSQKIKMSLQDLKSLSKFKNHQKSIKQKTQSIQKGNHKFKFSEKLHEQKNQQKTVIQNHKKINSKSKIQKQVLSFKELKIKSSQLISKHLEKKQKKDSTKNNVLNSLFESSQERKQFENETNLQQIERNLNFTFGKCC